MTTGICRILGCSLAISALVIGGSRVGLAAENKPTSGSEQLLYAGKIGTKAIDFSVRIEGPKAESTSDHQTPVVKLTASQNAYVTAVYIVPNGDAIVLLPNKETPDNLFIAGKEYSLFGPDSKIKLVAAHGQKQAKIVFYASSSPMKLDPLAIPDEQDFITIANSSAKDIELLLDRISSMSADENFNRKVLALQDESAKVGALGLMGLPTDVKSSRPQSVTGVQGLKGNKLDSQKE